MRYFEAPEWFNGKIDRFERTIFIAGGITGCPDFQKEIMEKIDSPTGLKSSVDLTLFNPRRKNFPIHDIHAAKEQIWWERAHLILADEILFWFPKETICPIVLYELGAWSNAKPLKKLYVGAHPEYSRIQDVIIQTRYVRPEIEVVGSLDLLVEQVFEISNKEEKK